MFPTADALAALFKVERSEEERYFGCVMLANALVNLEVIALWVGRTSVAPPARQAEDEEGSGG